MFHANALTCTSTASTLLTHTTLQTAVFLFDSPRAQNLHVEWPARLAMKQIPNAIGHEATRTRPRLPITRRPPQKSVKRDRKALAAASMLQGSSANVDSPLAAIVDSPLAVMVDSALTVMVDSPPPLLPPPPPLPPAVMVDSPLLPFMVVAAAGRFFKRRSPSPEGAGRFLLPLAIGSSDGGGNSLTGEGDGGDGGDSEVAASTSPSSSSGIGGNPESNLSISTDDIATRTGAGGWRVRAGELPGPRGCSGRLTFATAIGSACRVKTCTVFSHHRTRQTVR